MSLTGAAAVVLYALINSGDTVLLVVGVLTGQIIQTVMYAPLTPLLSELVGTGVRYTGVSLGYQPANLIGAGLTPMIAAGLLVASDGSSLSLRLLLAITACITIVAAWVASATSRKNLAADDTVLVSYRHCRAPYRPSGAAGVARQPIRRSTSMHPTGLTPNINVPDIDEARGFYADYLGLSVEEMNLGWVARFTTPDGRAVVQLVSGDETAPIDSAMSIHVGDEVEAAYEEAQRRGYEIVHPLTTEPWGVRRFFVRAPDGTVVNIVSHSDDQ